MTATLPPFVPLRWARGAHAQTILGYYWGLPALPSRSSGPGGARGNAPGDERHEIPVSDGDRLVVLYRPAPPSADPAKPMIHLFHGLGASSEAPYMTRIAAVFSRAGHPVARANHRGCGPGAGLAGRPYHGGRADDLAAVVAWGRALLPKRRHVAIGFSLSANAVLLLVGARHDLAQPDQAIAVNGPIDLARASALLEEGANNLYNAKYTLDCRLDLRRRVAAGLLPNDPGFRRITRLRHFDDLLTAPFGGFRDAAHYHASCSAAPHLRNVRVPTVALTAADDPFVDVRSYREAALSPAVTLRIEEHGGHMGFLADRPTELGTRHWLDLALLRMAGS